jgi:hypothetical protein
MGTASIGPGDDVEAWCTRCRMNLNHRVIAVLGNEVKRVHCLTCGGDHQYYSPKEGVLDKGPAKAPKPAQVKPEPRSSRRASGEWSRIMKEMPPDVSPRPYKVSDTYQPAEYIEHAVFGPGRILEILGRERIEVIFKEGRKVLICNKRKP